MSRRSWSSGMRFIYRGSNDRSSSLAQVRGYERILSLETDAGISWLANYINLFPLVSNIYPFIFPSETEGALKIYVSSVRPCKYITLCCLTQFNPQPSFELIKSLCPDLSPRALLQQSSHAGSPRNEIFTEVSHCESRDLSIASIMSNEPQTCKHRHRL